MIILFFDEFVAESADGFYFGAGFEGFELFSKIGDVDFDIVVFGEHDGAPDVG